MNDNLFDLLYSKSKIRIPFKGESLKDALSFGFSYLESEDHMVHFIAAGPRMMKRIFAEMPDSVLDPAGDSVGELWTAKLLLSRKLGDRQIIFSNEIFSAVVDLHLFQSTYPQEYDTYKYTK